MSTFPGSETPADSRCSGPDYERDPGCIERRSFEIIRQSVDLSAYDDDEQQVVMRMIHTSGDTKIHQHLQMSHTAVAAGVRAVTAGQPIFCDVEMLRSALSSRYLPGEKICMVGDPGVRSAAAELNHTRSMVAVDFWGERIAGSVVAIGNAPTALFRLLERVQANGEGEPPALIVGIPVGFVGAAESKAHLAEVAGANNIPYLTLAGRVGGSALTASVLNALGRIASGVRY